MIRSRSKDSNRLLALWLLLALGAGAARAGEWSGAWDTNWPGGAARLELTQDGDRVSGTYLPGNGVIEGTATGRELAGDWRDNSGSGSFRISLSGDGTTFFGRFAGDLWWTGQKVTTGAEAAFEADLSSPRAVLRSFLIAANAIRAQQLAYIEPALRCLDQETAADPSPDRRPRDRALLFFDVLDRTTLRLADIPARSEEAQLTVSLGQAGTEEAMELTRDRRARWITSSSAIRGRRCGPSSSRPSAGTREAARRSWRRSTSPPSAPPWCVPSCR